MNCKINSQWRAKIHYFVHKWRHGALLYLEKIIKNVFCLLTGVIAIINYADPIVTVFSRQGWLTPSTFFKHWGMTVPEVVSYTLKSIHQYDCWRMIEYITCYAKPEEIIKFVHNHNLNRYNNEHLTVIFWYIDWCFKIVKEEQTTCLRFCCICLQLAFE